MSEKEKLKQRLSEIEHRRNTISIAWRQLSTKYDDLEEKMLRDGDVAPRDNTRIAWGRQTVPTHTQLASTRYQMRRLVQEDKDLETERQEIINDLTKIEEREAKQKRFANMSDSERKAWVEKQRAKTEGLSEADSATDWYHAIEEDPQKRAEWDRQADIVSSVGSTIATLPFSIGSIGLVPTLTTAAGAYAGAYGGQKVGEAIDEKYGTNTTPWLSTIGSILGGGAGYRGMVNFGSKGNLRGAGNMYGPQFKSDVAYKILDNNISSTTPASILTKPIPYVSDVIQSQSKPHIDWFTAKKDYDRVMQIRRHNDFAQKYNSIIASNVKKYPIVPETISDEALDIATKKMLRQHNTYYRGVYYDEDLKELMKTKGLTLEEAFKYAATQPKTVGSNNMPNYTWITPIPRYAALYSQYGRPYEASMLNLWKRLARVRRNYTLGSDRTKWFDEADFSMDVGSPYAYNTQSDIVDIWGKPGFDPETVKTEYLGKNLIFDGWESSVDDMSFGSRNTKVKDTELINQDQ